MTYQELLEEAKAHISSEIVDYRPACGLYIKGMDDCERIPNAIVCWLENGSKIIYISNKEGDNS